ncbi:MAG: aminopeptidase P N-terminal domain-containing protein, partial [Gammaproteobacteria bacterium]|nr:aminopeptidase P N-terminal domain-containing protein [Gammaproteobacteria bacterium]
VAFRYRPDSDFFYLTGFAEPEAVLGLIPGRNQGEFILFCRERDPEQEVWHGSRAGLEGACNDFGADDAYPITDMDDILPGLLENRERIYYTMGNDIAFDQRVLGWVNQVRGKIRTGVHAPEEFISLNHILHDMRLYKSRYEISKLRDAATISAKAHVRAMKACRPGMMEYQVEAELLHEFMRRGAFSPAYPSIVGSGANSCVLHYIDNTREMKDGDILLIDAGAEYEGYASDVTRTFPVSGRFSDLQRAVYEVVLAAQLAAIDAVRPGNHWNQPHDSAVEVLTEGLVALGILKGSAQTLIEKEDYKRYFMHKTGHWLGMDVHDVGDYKLGNEWRMLEPGMALTVEPGLYFPPQKGLAKKWWNIGVRIEDDVLVTKSGHEVLSRDAPKSIPEIEALMAHNG